MVCVFWRHINYSVSNGWHVTVACRYYLCHLKNVPHQQQFIPRAGELARSYTGLYTSICVFGKLRHHLDFLTTTGEISGQNACRCELFVYFLCELFLHVNNFSV